MKRLFCLLAGLLVTAAHGSRLFADGVPTYSLVVENDKFAGTDQYYTSGQSIASMREDVQKAPWWAKRLVERFSLCRDVGASESCFRVDKGWRLALLIYTPEDITQTALLVNDHPYGGWLHATSIVELRNRTTSHRFELGLGLVGDHSLADDAQITLHRLIDAPKPRGWRNQLEDEPTLQLYYRFRRTVFEA